MWSSELYSTVSSNVSLARFDKDEIEPSGSVEGEEILE
jgi:hypothetical protein